MKLADKISRDTENFRPRIMRHKGGDITFRWPRPVNVERLAGVLGLDVDHFYRDSHSVFLDVPADVADSEADE